MASIGLQHAPRVARQRHCPQVLAGFEAVVEIRARARAANLAARELEPDDVVFAAANDGVDHRALRVEVHDGALGEVAGTAGPGGGCGVGCEGLGEGHGGSSTFRHPSMRSQATFGLQGCPDGFPSEFCQWRVRSCRRQVVKASGRVRTRFQFESHP